MPGIGVVDIFDQTVSLLLKQGLFETVNSHEPKHSPGPNHAACWVQSVNPTPAASGLAATAGRIELMIRLFSSMLAEPQDDIDPDLLLKTDEILGAFSSDFDLGSKVRNVDLQGAHGTPLSARAGYLPMDQNKIFRVMDITVPLIVNDIWNQEA